MVGVIIGYFAKKYNFSYEKMLIFTKFPGKGGGPQPKMKITNHKFQITNERGRFLACPLFKKSSYRTPRCFMEK